MKNIKKYLCVLFAMMMLSTALSGCKEKTAGGNDTGGTQINSTPTPKVEEPGGIGNGESPDNKDTGESSGGEEQIMQIIDNIGKEEPSPTNVATNVDEVKAPSSDDWNAFNFTLDNQEFKLPASYETFKATGWEIDLNYLGYPDGFVLNSRQKITGTVDAFNAKYRTVDNKYDMRLQIGFINNDSKAQDITKCDICSINVDVSRPMSDNKEYPKLVLAKGITWGSSKEEIEKAYGTPKDSTRSEELKYWTYTYQTPNYSSMRLVIYDDLGLVEVDLQNRE